MTQEHRPAAAFDLEATSSGWNSGSWDWEIEIETKYISKDDKHNLTFAFDHHCGKYCRRIKTCYIHGSVNEICVIHICLALKHDARNRGKDRNMQEDIWPGEPVITAPPLGIEGRWTEPRHVTEPPGLTRVSYGSHTSKRQISISWSTDLVSQPLNFAGQAIVHIVCFGLLLFCFVWILVDQRKDRLIFWLIREYQDTNTPLVNDFSKKTGSKREHQVGCHRVLLYVWLCGVERVRRREPPGCWFEPWLLHVGVSLSKTSNLYRLPGRLNSSTLLPLCWPG